jgi:transcriptional regulator with XRE-family HTH domain
METNKIETNFFIRGHHMSINMTQFRRLSKRRKDEKIYEIKPIGSAIKFRRKELKMTLEEGAQGICSISYLSKLENNLIEPNIDFVDQLIKRFDINENSYVEFDHYIDDLNLLLSLKLGQKKPHIDFTKSYTERKDYQSLLIQMCYYSLIEEDVEVIKAYSDLKTFIPNLNHFEYSLMLLSLSDVFIRNDKFQDAYELLLFEPISNDNIENISILMRRNRLICAFYTNKISEIIGNYQNYLDILYQSQNYHLIHEISKKYTFYMAYYQSPEHIMKKLNYLNSFSDSDKNALLVKTYYFNHQYEKIVELMSNDSLDNKESLMFYLMSLDILKNKTKLKEVIKILDHKNLCFSTKALIIYLENKLSSDSNQMLNYLRTEIIGLKKYTDHYILLEYLMMDAQNIFALHHHYKESSQVTKDLIPVLKNLRKEKILKIDEDL